MVARSFERSRVCREVRMRRFLADHMLQGLGRWLRAAGYDVIWLEKPSPLLEAFAKAEQANRLLLTRTKALPFLGDRGLRQLRLEGNSTYDHLVEVFSVFGPPDPERFLTRCTRCNTTLESMRLDDVRSRFGALRSGIALPARVCTGGEPTPSPSSSGS
jgi:uncharacterized protein with PIN domain